MDHERRNPSNGLDRLNYRKRYDSAMQRGSGNPSWGVEGRSPVY